MTRRLTEFAFAAILLVILFTVLMQAVSPYLPLVGIGIAVLLFILIGWRLYRFFVNRQSG